MTGISMDTEFALAAKAVARMEITDALGEAIAGDHDNVEKLAAHGITPEILQTAASMEVSKLAEVALILGKTLRIEIS